MEQIKNDLNELRLSTDLTMDRSSQRRQIHVLDYQQFLQLPPCPRVQLLLTRFVLFLCIIIVVYFIFVFIFFFSHLFSLLVRYNFCLCCLSLLIVALLRQCCHSYPPFAGLLLFGVKTDRFPLVLPVKGVRIWIVRHLTSPRPCFRAGYWV